MANMAGRVEAKLRQVMMRGRGHGSINETTTTTRFCRFSNCPNTSLIGLAVKSELSMWNLQDPGQAA